MDKKKSYLEIVVDYVWDNADFEQFETKRLMDHEGCELDTPICGVCNGCTECQSMCDGKVINENDIVRGIDRTIFLLAEPKKLLSDKEQINELLGNSKKYMLINYGNLGDEDCMCLECFEKANKTLDKFEKEQKSFYTRFRVELIKDYLNWVDKNGLDKRIEKIVDAKYRDDVKRNFSNFRKELDENPEKIGKILDKQLNEKSKSKELER